MLSHFKIEMHLLQVAAQCFGLPLDLVHSQPTSTAVNPNMVPSASSCGADIIGNAVLDACSKLKERLQWKEEETETEEERVGRWKGVVSGAFYGKVRKAGSGETSYMRLMCYFFLSILFLVTVPMVPKIRSGLIATIIHAFVRQKGIHCIWIFKINLNISGATSVSSNRDLKNYWAKFDKTVWFGTSMFQFGKTKVIKTLNMHRF